MFPFPGDDIDATTLGLVIGLPVGVLALAVLALAVLWRRAATRRSLLTGGVLAPKAGSATTLVVTDIQVSSAFGREPRFTPACLPACIVRYGQGR